MKDFPYSKNGMKQILDSPHKGFNKRCVALCAGNVFDPAYISLYIRPYSLCSNGEYVDPSWKPGHLRSWDFDHVGNVSSSIRRELDEYREDKNLVLMRVFGQGIIAYLDTRPAARVVGVWPEYGMPKARALLYWIKDAIETEEATK